MSRPPRMVMLLVMLPAVLIASTAARADAIGVLNELRMKGCGRASEPRSPLSANDKLSVAANYLSNDVALRDALTRAEYRADQSAVIRIRGTMTDESLRGILSKNYCDTLADPALRDVGVHQTAQGVAIIFAAPFAPPSQQDGRAVSDRVLKLVNEARARARRCGSKKFDAASPLSLNEKLQRAALLHAKDMAQRDRASHEGSDGSSPDERASRAGYAWTNVAENVAAGHLTADEVVAGWLSSPGHCANLMDSAYTQMGVAYVVNPKSALGIYWAQVFGRPRSAK